MTAPTAPDGQNACRITRGERARRIAAMTRLVRLIVHDENNFLTAIESNVASLRECLPQTGTELKYIDNLTQDLAFAKARIKALQAFLENGVAPIEPMHPALLLDRLRTPVNACIPDTVVVSFSLEPSLPTVPMAIEIVSQAILNTVRNACEAMAEEGDQLAIHVGMRDGLTVQPDDVFLLEYLRPEPMLCIEIANNGPPVDAVTREQLFDPGYTTHMRAPGLGLSAVMGTMLTHCGCIEIPPRSDGFTLRMLFPVKQPPRTPRL